MLELNLMETSILRRFIIDEDGVQMYHAVFEGRCTSSSDQRAKDLRIFMVINERYFGG